MLSFKEAARYLDKHPQTLEYYHKNELLVPDLRYGKLKSRLYKYETLDKFKREYLMSTLPTLTEIAKMYHVSEQAVKYHFRTKRKVRPSGNRGISMTFAWEDVSKVAIDEGWHTR